MGVIPIRPIRIEGNVAYVTLTKGYEAVIDAADAAYIGQWNWKALERPTAVRASRSQTVDGVSRFIYMHRILLRPPEGFMVDHINGNALDNRRANLRIATHAQNNQNSRTPRSNTSGYKGVSAINGKWRASIRASGKIHYLGNFATPEAAYAAYCEASANLHGEYSRIA